MRWLQSILSLFRKRESILSDEKIAERAARQYRRHFLRGEIPRLQRNKKRHSHLLAELRALGG